jgi:hypothetical protein
MLIEDKEESMVNESKVKIEFKDVENRITLVKPKILSKDFMKKFPFEIDDFESIRKIIKKGNFKNEDLFF